MADESADSSNSEESSDSVETSLKNRKKRKLKSSEGEPPKKRIRRLPKISKLFNKDGNEKKENKYNDSSQHQGRKRRFEHVDGCWSVHFFIPINAECSSSLDTLYDECVEDNGDKDLHRMEQYHLSLSICQSIRTHQISDFVESATKILKGNEAFNITINGINCFENDTKQRYFGSLLVTDGKEKIIHLIALVNELMLKWGMKKYYDKPQPHVSFLWSLQSLDKIFDGGKSMENKKLAMTVNTINLKIGNRMYSIKLC